MDREEMKDRLHQFLLDRGLVEEWKYAVRDNADASVVEFLNDNENSVDCWVYANAGCSCSSCMPNRELAAAAEEWAEMVDDEERV